MEQNKKTNTAILRFSSGRGNQMEIKFPNVVSKKNAIEDIYIDSFTAEVYVNYGKKDGDIRAIEGMKWEESKSLSTEEKNSFLIENSHLVEVDDEQIQNMMQEIHHLTRDKEQQIYIYLSRETFKITSIKGKEGTDGECIIESYRFIKEYNEKGEKIVSPPMIEVENIKGALLGQVHTHNLVQNKERKNKFGPSEKDEKSASNLGIYIYVLDSWNFWKKNAEVYIYRVSPTGIMKKVGTTRGKGDAENIVNVGLECLNFRVGR